MSLLPDTGADAVADEKEEAALEEMVPFHQEACYLYETSAVNGASGGCQHSENSHSGPWMVDTASVLEAWAAEVVEVVADDGKYQLFALVAVNGQAQVA